VTRPRADPLVTNFLPAAARRDDDSRALHATARVLILRGAVAGDDIPGASATWGMRRCQRPSRHDSFRARSSRLICARELLFSPVPPPCCVCGALSPVPSCFATPVGGGRLALRLGCGGARVYPAGYLLICVCVLVGSLGSGPALFPSRETFDGDGGERGGDSNTATSLARLQSTSTVRNVQYMAYIYGTPPPRARAPPVAVAVVPFFPMVIYGNFQLSSGYMLYGFVIVIVMVFDTGIIGRVSFQPMAMGYGYGHAGYYYGGQRAT